MKENKLITTLKTQTLSFVCNKLSLCPSEELEKAGKTQRKYENLYKKTVREYNKLKSDKFVTERCDHCNTDVKLPYSLGMYLCPNCGNLIVNCSVCKYHKCFTSCKFNEMNKFREENKQLKLGKSLLEEKLGNVQRENESLRKGRNILMRFEIPGKPIPKQSARFTKRGFAYTSKNVTEYANWVKLCFKEAYPNHLTSYFFEKPIKVFLKVYMEVPKSYPKKKKEKCLRDEIRPLVKPDCDNLSKNILDALNGILYPDDRQIVELTVEKFYGEEPKVIFEVEEC